MTAHIEIMLKKNKSKLRDVEFIEQIKIFQILLLKLKPWLNARRILLQIHHIILDKILLIKLPAYSSCFNQF